MTIPDSEGLASQNAADVAISVVVPVHNEELFVADQLEALARQEWTEPWELVVVDSGCTDRSIEIVERFAPRFTRLLIVRTTGPSSAAHARNVGARAASGRAIAFCDADDVVGEGWLSAMGNAVERLGFVACRLDHVRLNSLVQRTARGLIQQQGLLHYYLPYLPYSGSGTLAIRRSIHNQVGGFDETFTSGGEDPDYCWRVQSAGYELHFVPEAVLHYRYRTTWGGMWRQARGYGRFHVHLYDKYRDHGLPAVDHQWRAGVLLWLRVMAGLLRIRSRPDLAKWIWKVGWSVGLLEGSVERRVVFLCSDPADARLPTRLAGLLGDCDVPPPRSPQPGLVADDTR